MRLLAGIAPATTHLKRRGGVTQRCLRGLGHLAAGSLCLAILFASTCSPTDPEIRLITFSQQVQGGTVYVTEPIDYSVSATADDLTVVSVQASGLPTTATFQSTTGGFSWRPALSDTGSKIVTFSAGEGAEQVAMNVNYTVVLPTLDTAADEYIKVLRPAGGETYTYGDTIMLAFAITGCSWGTDIGIFNNGVTYRTQIGCPYAMAYESRLSREGDSLDLRGVVCRYFRHLPEVDMNLGFYKLALVDTALDGCSADFGGGMVQRDSIRIAIADMWTSYGCLDRTVSDSLYVGVKSGYFSVTP